MKQNCWKKEQKIRDYVIASERLEKRNWRYHAFCYI